MLAKSYLVLAVLSLGVGGAVVLRGDTWPGAHGMAAEPGHLPVRHIAAIHINGNSAIPIADLSTADQTISITEEPTTASPEMDLPPCRCGQAGHVEAFAAPRAILERARTRHLIDDRLDEIDELAARPRTEAKLAELFLQGGVALGRTIAAGIDWIDPERVLVYLPNALDETNIYLAGSFYRAGLYHEIDQSTFSAGRQTPVKIIGTSDVEMNDRLAQAAAYLVFAKLIDCVEDAGKKGQSDEGAEPTPAANGRSRP